MQERYLKLTDAIYRVIEFFPENEPLKNKIKEKSLEVMENLVLFSGKPADAGKLSTKVLKDIEVLKEYFRLGKSQGWLDSLNFFIISKEYDKIKEGLQSAKEVQSEETAPTDNFQSSPIINEERQAVFAIEQISDRQKKILEILGRQEKAQVGDFKKTFSSVSKRTLRRDLDDLLQKKKIIRVGEWNQVFYKVNEG